jgi:MscS family membrane protein
MKPKLGVLFLTLSLFPVLSFAKAASAPLTDPIGRSNPRSTVTSFLQACQDNNYTKAAQYLDLLRLPVRYRSAEGPQLAKQLESILNSDSHFDILHLSQSAEGNLADDTDPNLEHIAAVSKNSKTFSIELERVQLQPENQVWLFSPATVAAIPSLTPETAKSTLEKRLPGFLVKSRLLETPIWKWLALLVAAAIVLLLFHIVGRILLLFRRKVSSGSVLSARWLLVESLLQPILVFLAAMAFVVVEQYIDPSALSRLYIGRAILLAVVWSLAWCFLNLVDMFLARLDRLLDPKQRAVSHSILYIGRRAAKVAIVAIAAIVILDNWGYNMTTLIAGLGVGGIAVALAAQGTIANIFGGVSVIADHPVMVGDFGSFGGIVGKVQDIGMRSTRVRTLSRTMMSIPNAAFAGMNLENYELRDKILFNPTFQIKRDTPKEKIRQVMKALGDNLNDEKRIEAGPSPIRIVSLAAASFGLEMFAYVLTTDINEFYKVEADLYLQINDTFSAAGIELV